MATHSGVLAWEIPWTEEPGRLPSMWLQESDMTGETNTFTFSPLAISLYGSNVLDRMQLLNSESLLWACYIIIYIYILHRKFIHDILGTYLYIIQYIALNSIKNPSSQKEPERACQGTAHQFIRGALSLPQAGPLPQVKVPLSTKYAISRELLGLPI